MKKFYHDSQPEVRLKSTRMDEPDEDGLRLISELKDTYEDYKNLINKSKSTRTSDAGKKWLDIISTRLKWLSEDEVAIKKKLKDCEHEKVEVDKKLQRRCADQMRPVLNKLLSFEDKLDNVVRHKESASKNNEEIQKVLRDTYREAHDIRKAFCKRLDKAIDEAKAARSA